MPKQLDLIRQPSDPIRERSIFAVSPRFVDVAVPLHVRESFTYRLAEGMQHAAKVGARVVVPFGHQHLTGYIVAIKRALDENSSLKPEELKEVESLLDAEPLITPEILELTRWVAEYYAAPWGEVLKAALPAGINASIERVVEITAAGREDLQRLGALRTKNPRAQILKFVSNTDGASLKSIEKLIGDASAIRVVRALERDGLVNLHHRALSDETKPKRRKAVRLLDTTEERTLTEPQQRVIDSLIRHGREMLFTDLLDEADVTASSIQTLAKHARVEISVRDIRRDPLANATLPKVEEFELTEAQSHAIGEISKPLSESRYATLLLHGVTGSGKTEIYIRAMRKALELGRSAMMLVPEIALTPVFSRRLRAHFGDLVAILHSSLSEGERFDEWSRVKSGQARVVIGTRSAVFAPVTDLGIIVVDEEHETSYRQQDSPHYHGRDTAIMRARNAGAVVVLGSATPSLESFHNSHTGKSTYLRLPHRIGDRPLASAEIIDMRTVFKAKGMPEVFSDQLLNMIRETHSRGEQSIILLNRRGYSSFILCRSCGVSIHCPNCDVTLTFHRAQRSLICHYCDFRRPAPSVCPNCQSKHIYYIGEGTEQIEESLKKLFPELRIARLDRDTTKRRNLFEQTILQFDTGKIDMLVGTQMLAKGHDFPNVTLVGVVSVDAGLALPDFRSAERTFQLLTQVAGRAGRGDRPGRVLIQTYYPEHYALQHACDQSYEGFYQQEISFRQRMSYPPFVALGSLLIHDEDYAKANRVSLALRELLDSANSDSACRILGPAQAPLARLRGEHRIHILIKSRSRASLRAVIDDAMKHARTASIDTHIINIEIDPINLL